MCQYDNDICTFLLQDRYFLFDIFDNIFSIQHSGVIGSFLSQSGNCLTDQTYLDWDCLTGLCYQLLSNDLILCPNMCSCIDICNIRQYHLAGHPGRRQLFLNIIQCIIKFMISKCDRIVSHLGHRSVHRLLCRTIYIVYVIRCIIKENISQIK